MRAGTLGPVVRPRVIDPQVETAALGMGLDPVLARIVAGRIKAEQFNPKAGLMPTLAHLDDPAGLSDISKAAGRIATAIQRGEVIGLATDHDADGVTSCAVFHEALVRIFGHPQSKVSLYISHRLREGYGLNAAVAARILAADPRPQLIITADKGSSDEAQIAQLARAGIDVIVSDHHEFPEDGNGAPVPPASAVAVVSPRHPASRYPDKAIAGCMVAWLLIVQVFRYLRDRQWPMRADLEAVKELLTFVAVGTVADCVSLASSVNNRAIVREGLARIQASERPAWRAMRAQQCANGNPLRTDTLAFQLCPRLAAAGRVDVAEPGVRFLLSASLEEAERWLAFLNEENEARKLIERRLTQTAIEKSDVQVAEGRQCIVVDLGVDGHSGVHGIVASRIVERHGRPVVMLSPKQGSAGVISGSCRSVPGVHMRGVLQSVASHVPGLLHRFGGHAGAAGLTLSETDIPKFRATIESAVREQLAGRLLESVRYTDGELPPEAFSVEFLDRLLELEPFGREFEYPMFSGTFEVRDVRTLGRDGAHLQLTLGVGDRTERAVWFHAREPGASELPVVPGEHISTLYQFTDNFWKNRRSLQLVIENASVLPNPQLVADRGAEPVPTFEPESWAPAI